MRKNWLCLLLTLALLVASVAVSADTSVEEIAAEQESVTVEIPAQQQDAIALLQALGIQDATDENAAEIISRGAFAKLACQVAGYPMVNLSQAVFDDVPLDNAYAKYIQTLETYGAVSGFSDNTFRPDMEMRTVEAAIVLVRVLNHEFLAEVRGGYPTGYSSIAKELKLYNGISAGERTPLTYGVAALLCENALKACTGETIHAGDEISYRQSDITLGERAFDISIKKGIVEGVDLSRLYGVNDIPPYHMSIGGETLDYGTVDALPYLGYEVEAYLKEIKGIDRVFYIRKTVRNAETVLDIETIRAIESGKIRYVDDDKTRSAQYAMTAAILYNGVATGTGFDNAMVKDKLGTVRLLDNNNDGLADVVFIDAYENYVVAAKDAENSIIYDYYDKNKKIALDPKEDDPYVVIYGEDGEELSFSSIKNFSVVTVYASLPDAYQQFRRAYLSSQTVRGEVLGISRTALGVEVELASGTYVLSDACYLDLQSKAGAEGEDGDPVQYLKPGVVISITLDRSGKGAYAVLSASEGAKYGYLIHALPGGAIGGRPQFKIFTLENQAEEFNCAPSITIDGVRYKAENGRDIIAVLKLAAKENDPNITDPDCMSQLMKYTLDSEGRVSYIDTVLKDASGELGTYDDAKGENALFRKILPDGVRFRGNSESFMGVGQISSATTPVFLHPIPGGDYLNEENYEVRTNYFATDFSYKNVKLFYDRQNALTSSAVSIGVKIGSDLIPERSQFCFLNDTSRVLAEDGSVLTNLHFYLDGSLQKAACAEDVAFYKYSEAEITPEFGLSDMKLGDVFRYNLNNKGQICKIEMIYSPGTISSGNVYPGVLYSPTDTTEFYSSFRVRMFQPLNNFDDGIQVQTLGEKIMSFDPEGIEIITKTGSVMVYDPQARDNLVVRPATFEDVKAANATDDPSLIMVHQWWGVTQSAYIIKQ